MSHIDYFFDNKIAVAVLKSSQPLTRYKKPWAQIVKRKLQGWTRTDLRNCQKNIMLEIVIFFTIVFCFLWGLKFDNFLWYDEFTWLRNEFAIRLFSRVNCNDWWWIYVKPKKNYIFLVIFIKIFLKYLFLVFLGDKSHFLSCANGFFCVFAFSTPNFDRFFSNEVGLFSRLKDSHLRWPRSS